MYRGYIKLWRKIEDNSLSHDPDFMALWVWILILANHTPKEWKVGYTNQPIKRGEFCTSRKSLADITGVQESKVERLLKYLESEQQIEQVKTTKYRLIIVKNYQEYQGNGQRVEQQVNNKRTTSEQQVNTTKECKNVKNDKKEIVQPTADDYKSANLLKTLIKENLPTFKCLDIDSWAGDIDKLHRIDKYTYQQIDYIIKWCQSDDFWRGNILSTGKLRKQFITLIAQAQRTKKPKTVQV